MTFDINEFDIKVEQLYGSKIYIVENFYKDPDKVVRKMSMHQASLWKSDEPNSYNGIHFEDRRHGLQSSKVARIYDKLSEVCGQDPSGSTYGRIVTNYTKFKSGEFNNYTNNYWWPHVDDGYNGIVFLNNNLGDKSGTNLYENLDSENEPPKGVNEHEQPWRSKSKYKLLLTLEPAYNKLYLFDGKRFPHGMNICDDMYFGNEYRFNQVFFFDYK
jgi:hypothetical protein